MLNKRHNLGGGGVHYHLMSMRIFTLVMYKILIRALEITRKLAIASLWICQASHTNLMFHILGEVD